jgi:hypothetical protein
VSVSSDKDLIGKADGLMRRGVSPPGSGGDTGGVPILTDLVDESLPAPAAAPAATPTRAAPVREPSSELAREIFTRVIAEVEGRLAADLERRLTQHLIPQVHAAVASALGDLHQELANAIGDAVTRALEARNLK